MNRVEIRRKVSGMTSNDDRLSGERKRHLEPSVTVMGKTICRKEKPSETLTGHFRELSVSIQLQHISSLAKRSAIM